MNWDEEILQLTYLGRHKEAHQLAAMQYLQSQAQMSQSQQFQNQQAKRLMGAITEQGLGGLQNAGQWVNNNANNIVAEAKSISTKSKGVSMLASFRSYVDKHKEVLFTVVLAIAADHFVFGGAFTGKIKGLIEKLLDRAQKVLE